VTDDKDRECAARLRDIERQSADGMRAIAAGKRVPVFVPPPPLTVYAVMEDVDYTGTFLDSLWATQELADAEVKRLTTKHKRNKWDVEEYTLHCEPREEEP
jgi:hypothetical protein